MRVCVVGASSDLGRIHSITSWIEWQAGLEMVMGWVAGRDGRADAARAIDGAEGVWLLAPEGKWPADPWEVLGTPIARVRSEGAAGKSYPVIASGPCYDHQIFKSMADARFSSDLDAMRWWTRFGEVCSG